MKRKAHILSLGVLIVLAAPIGLLHGCGHNKTSSAPLNSTIAISPDGASWTITQSSQPGAPVLPGCNGTIYNFELFTITVSDALGNPINNAEIVIDLDTAANTASPSSQVMYLADADVNLTQPVAVPYETKTDKFGTKNVRVFVDLGGCSFSGNLKVYSGTVFKSVSIKVTGVY